MTFVIVTHEMDVVRSLCHRAALMDQGRVLEVMTITDGELTGDTALAKALLEA